MSAPKIPRNTAGFGLVEVMISIAISLIVILAVTGLYLTQRSAYTTQGALSLVQENARYLMRVMTHDLRMSGYRDINATTTFTTNAAGSKLFIDAQNDVGTQKNDVLTLRFYGASDTSGTADGSISNCARTAIGRDTMVTQKYEVMVDTESLEPSLYCTIVPPSASTVAAPPTLLVSGVESLQMLFVVDLDGDGASFSYQPAGVADVSKAVSVLVSVVMRSNTIDNVTLGNSPGFNHFGTQYARDNVAPSNDPGSVFNPPKDGRLRKHVTFSVALRNRLD